MQTEKTHSVKLNVYVFYRLYNNFPLAECSIPFRYLVTFLLSCYSHLGRSHLSSFLIVEVHAWGAEWAISHVSIYDMNSYSSMFVLPIKMSAICIQRETHQIHRNLQQISLKLAHDCRSHLIFYFSSPFDSQRENGKRQIFI